MKSYYNRHGNAGQTYWRCVNQSCSCRVTLDIHDRVQSVNEKHFHQQNQAKTEAEEVIECMKKRAKEETISIPKIYQEALCGIATDESEEVATVLPTFQSIRTQLHNKRREQFPPHPSSVKKN